MYVFIIGSATTAVQTGAQASPCVSTGIVFCIVYYYLLLLLLSLVGSSLVPATSTERQRAEGKN